MEQTQEQVEQRFEVRHHVLAPHEYQKDMMLSNIQFPDGIKFRVTEVKDKFIKATYYNAAKGELVEKRFEKFGFYYSQQVQVNE